MKVLIINGSPRKDGNTALAVKEAEKIFNENDLNKIENVLINKYIYTKIKCLK